MKYGSDVKKGSILLLEDDALLGETLEDLLDEAGYEVQWCRNGQAALDCTYERTFSLYLLDVKVPQIDGLTLLRSLRGADDSTPAIFLTSYGDKADRKAGFEGGADDYIVKPFDNDELLWRIEALLRRSGLLDACSGGLCIDEQHRTILQEGEPLALTNKEYELLRLLIRHRGKTVTKPMIEEVLWQAQEHISDGALRVYVNRLKHLIGKDRIENIRGVGYRLVS